MKTILAICLITAGFAMIPGASASNCDPTFTVCEGSYAYGDCTNGFNANYVSAGAGGVYAGASTSCGGYPGYYSYSAIGAYVYGPNGYTTAQWYGFNFFGSEFCDAYVYDSNAGYNSLGCPAGAPPAIPAVLP